MNPNEERGLGGGGAPSMEAPSPQTRFTGETQPQNISLDLNDPSPQLAENLEAMHAGPDVVAALQTDTEAAAAVQAASSIVQEAAQNSRRGADEREAIDASMEAGVRVDEEPTENPPAAAAPPGEPPKKTPTSETPPEPEPEPNSNDSIDKTLDPNTQRRDDLSIKVMNGSATEGERSEFARLADGSFQNGELTPAEKSEPEPALTPEPQPTLNQEEDPNIAGSRPVMGTEIDPNNNGLDPAEAQAVQLAAAEAEAGNQTAQSGEAQKRIDELEGRLKDTTNPLSDEEFEELKNLRDGVQSENRLQELEAMDPKKMKNSELDEMRELQKKKAEKDNPELTPEQQAEKRDKELEELGTEIMQKLAKGEEITPEEEERLQKLFAGKKLEEAGFTPEQAREAAKKGLELNRGKSEKGSKRTQEARERIQELMSLELQLIAQRNQVVRLRDERKTAINEAQAARKVAETADPKDRMRKKGLEYSAYMKVANISGQIEGVKYAAQRINARRTDLEQQVRRKLGVTGGLRALGEWAGAKATNIMTEISIIAEEKLPFGMGVDQGEDMRSWLAATGRA